MDTTHRHHLLFVPLLAVLTFSFITQANAFTTVVIDAGHGGKDFGASDSLVYEKHINLDVARRLELVLKEAGFRTVLIRTKDKYVDLTERSTIANRYRNAVFVSIHFNSSWKTSALGIETFYRSSKGQKFAGMIQRELIKNIGAVDRGVKTANFSVLRRTRHPAVLVEGGFVSNNRERSAMLDPRFRQTVAESIARGIMQYNRRF